MFIVIFKKIYAKCSFLFLKTNIVRIFVSLLRWNSTNIQNYIYNLILPYYLKALLRL